MKTINAGGVKGAICRISPWAGRPAAAAVAAGAPEHIAPHAADLIDLYRAEPRDNRGQPVHCRSPGLVKISVGESWLMVNQTRWKAICEPQPKSHGGGDGFASG